MRTVPISLKHTPNFWMQRFLITFVVLKYWASLKNPECILNMSKVRILEIIIFKLYSTVSCLYFINMIIWQSIHTHLQSSHIVPVTTVSCRKNKNSHHLYLSLEHKVVFWIFFLSWKEFVLRGCTIYIADISMTRLYKYLSEIP